MLKKTQSVLLAVDRLPWVSERFKGETRGGKGKGEEKDNFPLAADEGQKRFPKEKGRGGTRRKETSQTLQNEEQH